MPGCGKSTVGRNLARHLGLSFVDADAEVELRIGMSIRVFFETHGESDFREVEQDVIDAITQREGSVIATGGGAVLRPANREALRARCQVFYLRASPEELYKRLRHDLHRPLLQVADPRSRLREMFRQRDPLYRETAHYVIEPPRGTMHRVLDMLLMQIELGANQGLPAPASAAPAAAAPTAPATAPRAS